MNMIGNWCTLNSLDEIQVHCLPSISKRKLQNLLNSQEKDAIIINLVIVDNQRWRCVINCKNNPNKPIFLFSSLILEANVMMVQLWVKNVIWGEIIKYGISTRILMIRVEPTKLLVTNLCVRFWNVFEKIFTTFILHWITCPYVLDGIV